MSRLGYHLCIRLRDRGVIARDAVERRLVARAVLRHGKEAGLHSFALPDTHLHMGQLGGHMAPGELCRRVEITLTKQLGLKVGFEMLTPIPIRDQAHLEQVARYILTQHVRHQVAADPFRESTNLPDILGLRVIGGDYSLNNLRSVLPRLTYETVLAWLGAQGLPSLSEPLLLERLERAKVALGAETLATTLREAGLRAACLPDLLGSRPLVVATRRALIEVAGNCLPPRLLALALGIDPGSLTWLRRRPARPELVKAIRLQLCLEDLISKGRSAA
ncbi:MAG: hypothetical protein RBU30_12875 [Polyangia bacterium]|jgi:hypothetical protein|nr:hypothetical protein [Polyangia bacterium]